MKAADVLEGLRRIAFCDMREFVDANGHPVPLEEWPDELATCVDVIECDDKTGRVKRIRVDHLGALDKLARHLNLLRPEVTPKLPGVGEL